MYLTKLIPLNLFLLMIIKLQDVDEYLNIHVFIVLFYVLHMHFDKSTPILALFH